MTAPTPLFRIMLPGQMSRSQTPPKIHYEAPDGQRSICTQAEIFSVVDGEKLRVWHRTKRPVTCRPCTKRLEMTVRSQLATLTSDQLEDIAAHIGTFRLRLGRRPS